jgi:two-component system, chemotaxis family, response regulator Rcp1
MTSPVHILLAEDNPGDVLLMREALEQHGLQFELCVADDGDKLRSILTRLGSGLPQPDLVLLDINLPRVEVPELFRLIREHPLCSDVPVIVVTSSDSPKDRAWTDQFRVTHYFRKPSDYEAYMELGNLVRGTLEGKSLDAKL